MKVEAEFKIAFYNGVEVKVGDDKTVKVHNVWNRRDLIEIEVKDVRFAVKMSELEAAINAVRCTG